MSERRPFTIVGAGGLGRGIAALFESLNQSQLPWDLTGFVDDASHLHGDAVLNYPIRGDVDWLCQQEPRSYIIAIGDGPSRFSIADRLDKTSHRPIQLVHPSVSIHRTVDIQEGVVIRHGTSLAVDLRVGSHVVINMGCTLGHDVTVEAFSTLHPGVHLSGDVHVETGATIGSGAVVLPEVSIGPHASVGAGAVVTRDLPANCTAVGVPARPQA